MSSMQLRNEPTIGAWYVNATGKLMKVKMMVYQQGKPSAVMIEYLDGSRQVIGIGEWTCLELNKHLTGGGSVLFQN